MVLGLASECCRILFQMTDANVFVANQQGLWPLGHAPPRADLEYRIVEFVERVTSSQQLENPTLSIRLAVHGSRVIPQSQRAEVGSRI